MCSVNGQSLQWKSDLLGQDLEFYEMDDPGHHVTSKGFNATLLENSNGTTSCLKFLFNESYADHIMTCVDSNDGDSVECTIEPPNLCTYILEMREPSANAGEIK